MFESHTKLSGESHPDSFFSDGCRGIGSNLMVTLWFVVLLAEMMEKKLKWRRHICNNENVFKDGCLLLLLRIRSAHLEILGFPMGCAY